MTILDLTLPTPAENLACDEALLDAAEADNSGEVLRFWESPAYFVVLGYANRAATEVHLAACQARGIPVLRRCSGGGTVLQGPGCLNYSLVLQISPSGPTHGISTANQFIMERNRAAVAAEIRNPKSEIRIEGHTDLALAGRKFSGNAQRRRQRHLLFHGTFLLACDLPLLAETLRLPTQQPEYRNRRPHADFLTCLEVPRESLKAGLARAWEATSGLASVPHDAIADLVRERYGKPEWNVKF